MAFRLIQYVYTLELTQTRKQSNGSGKSSLIRIMAGVDSDFQGEAWAAKGTRLLGVRAVIAESFERIHRSNLVGLGVLPLEFTDGHTAKSLGLGSSSVPLS